MRFHFALIPVCLACSGGTGLAQDLQGASSEERTAVASRAAGPIVLDGRLDEAAAAYEFAISCSANQTERDFLQHNLEAIGRPD